jgi:hypothetical protein
MVTLIKWASLRKSVSKHTAKSFMRLTHGCELMFTDRYFSYYQCKQKMTSFRGLGSWAKIMSSSGQANSTDKPSNQKVNKAGD